jgi:hypothetical protein
MAVSVEQFAAIELGQKRKGTGLCRGCGVEIVGRERTNYMLCTPCRREKARKARERGYCKACGKPVHRVGVNRCLPCARMLSRRYYEKHRESECAKARARYAAKKAGAR